MGKYADCAHRAMQEMEQDSSAYQECRHPANMLLLLFLGYASSCCTDTQFCKCLCGSFTTMNHLPNSSCTLRHCKDKHAGETEPSRKLATLAKTFVSVKNHRSRIHTPEQLKSLHGVGPFTCAVRPKLIPLYCAYCTAAACSNSAAAAHVHSLVTESASQTSEHSLKVPMLQSCTMHP